MRSAYERMGAQFLTAAPKPPAYFIVERETPMPGTGESYTLYLALPGEWKERESDAMRFPQRALAEFYARQFKGVVMERTP